MPRVRSLVIGLPAPPIPLRGMAVLKVAVSALAPALFNAPGTARPTQLLMLVQVLSTGAFVQVWLAAKTEGARDAAARNAAIMNLLAVLGRHMVGTLLFDFIRGLVLGNSAPVGHIGAVGCWGFMRFL